MSTYQTRLRSRTQRWLPGHLLLVPLALIVSAHHLAAASVATPQVLYTDIISGPNTGGENNLGVYLSVFGQGFGSAADLGAGTKLLINNHEVASYRSLGPSHGRPDIQQLTVQIGSLGNPTPGTALPITVVVQGESSNSNLTFTVNPGRILFVDNVHGVDATAVIGDITHPYRHVQTNDLSAAAWGQVQAGDVLVMRGTGTPWNDLGYGNYFMRARDKSGSAPTGAPGTGPISLIGYPGEDVFIQTLTTAGTSGGAISAINGQSYPGMGQWVTIANLRVDGDRDDGPINVEIAGSNWRVVNNDLSAPTATTSAKAAGITGNGFLETWVGNHIHDISCGPAGTGPLQNHGIYIDGDGSYEIAYNLIERIPGGNGFQSYVNGGNGSSETNTIHLHHNIIRQTGKHGVNIADNTHTGVVVSNNVVCDTALAGIRFNTTLLADAIIVNNTFENTNTTGSSVYGSITNDATFANAPNAFEIRNNIFRPAAGTPYNGGAQPGVTAAYGIIANNLWYGGIDSSPSLAAATVDSHAVSGNPLFVSTTVGAENLQLQVGSAAIDAVTSANATAVAAIVTTDVLSTIRPQGSGYDIGAYECVPGTPPTISQLTVGPVSASGANVTWTTSLPADSQIDYGTTTAYGMLSPLLSARVTAHSQALSGLTASTTYHLRVRSRDAAGDLVVSGDALFVTAASGGSGLVISSVSAGAIGAGVATITWTTNVAADSQIAYGPTLSYGNMTTLQASQVTGHSQMLTGLTPGTTYHVQVHSHTTSGASAQSSDLTFSTTTTTAPSSSPQSTSTSSDGPHHCGLGSAVALVVAGCGLCGQTRSRRRPLPTR